MHNELYLVWVPGAVLIISLAVFWPFGKKREIVSQRILQLLTHEWIRGRNLKQRLSKEGLHISKRSFGSIMDELVQDGEVLCQEALPQLEDGGNSIRTYKLPLTGKKAEPTCSQTLVGHMTSRPV